MYGAKLKELRKKLNLSQEEMAIKTDVTYRAYTSYERGDRKPSFDFLEKLVINFDVNLNWLIADKGEAFFIQNDKTNYNIIYTNIKKDILNDVNEMLVQKGILKTAN